MTEATASDRTSRRLGACLVWAMLICVLAATTFDAWVRNTDLPDLTPEVSTVVLDRSGHLLRAYTTREGHWRLPTTCNDVDPGYLSQLVAFEDKRFYTHSGVDPAALLRAAFQAATSGRIVSGGSTLTMQVARLLERRNTRSPAGKLRQIRVALALERQLTKDEILDLYLVLAPFGGNIEGVRAASLSWFGKEPRRLSRVEAAMLVALPQAPETRRPDRHPEALRMARARVLARTRDARPREPRAAEAGLDSPLPVQQESFPALAPHLADALRRTFPHDQVIRTTIDRRIQAAAHRLLHDRVSALDHHLSAAMIIVDHRSGAIITEIGSSSFLDGTRRGWIDMAHASRSPGSTLKPLIYGLGFDAGRLHPETTINDRPMRFGDYEPRNFDKQWHGTVSIRRALQMSLNVPAVAVLDAVRPAHLIARMRRAGLNPTVPQGGLPGLAIGLGGVGLSLYDLATLYTAIARGGIPVELRNRPGPTVQRRPIMSPKSAWYVADILSGTPPPVAGALNNLAFKTGTSYGHRDAWAIGFDGAHVIAVWVGRADGAPIPGALGIDLAAPILFEAFGRLKPTPIPLAPPPPDALTVSTAALPQPLQVFRPTAGSTVIDSRRPEITFPPNGARLPLDPDPASRELVIKVRHGTPPYTWMVDGQPLRTLRSDREATWRPDGRGHVAIAVIDALGHAARARIFLQ